MTFQIGHTHECRECGTGFPCNGEDDWRGCADFNGLCRTCEIKEVTP